MNEMDSLIQGQYSFAVSCWFLLPTANAIRLTDQPRLPGGLSNGFMLNTNIRNLSLYPLPKVKWFYGHSDKIDFTSRLLEAIEFYSIYPIVFNVFENHKTELNYR